MTADPIMALTGVRCAFAVETLFFLKTGEFLLATQRAHFMLRQNYVALDRKLILV